MKQNMLWKKFKKINKGENMFLNQLLSNEKEAFVSLSIHAAKANNVIEKEEIAMIEEYCKEMEIESFDLENAMEIDKILEIYEKSEQKHKKIVLLETLGLLYADGEYDEQEKRFIYDCSEKIGLTKADVDRVEKLLGRYLNIVKDLVCEIG